MTRHRPRIPKDYHYILSSIESIGSADPTTYIIQLRGLDYFDTILSSVKTYESEYKDVKERRDIFARQLALEEKIEQTQVRLYSCDYILVCVAFSGIQRLSVTHISLFTDLL